MRTMLKEKWRAAVTLAGIFSLMKLAAGPGVDEADRYFGCGPMDTQETLIRSSERAA
jgi:hypothetical protein